MKIRDIYFLISFFYMFLPIFSVGMEVEQGMEPEHKVIIKEIINNSKSPIQIIEEKKVWFEAEGQKPISTHRFIDYIEPGSSYDEEITLYAADNAEDTLELYKKELYKGDTESAQKFFTEKGKLLDTIKASGEEPGSLKIIIQDDLTTHKIKLKENYRQSISLTRARSYTTESMSSKKSNTKRVINNSNYPIILEKKIGPTQHETFTLNAHSKTSIDANKEYKFKTYGSNSRIFFKYNPGIKELEQVASFGITADEQTRTFEVHPIRKQK